jgi:hypothetical protein
MLGTTGRAQLHLPGHGAIGRRTDSTDGSWRGLLGPRPVDVASADSAALGAGQQRRRHASGSIVAPNSTLRAAAAVAARRLLEGGVAIVLRPTAPGRHGLVCPTASRSCLCATAQAVCSPAPSPRRAACVLPAAPRSAVVRRSCSARVPSQRSLLHSPTTLLHLVANPSLQPSLADLRSCNFSAAQLCGARILHILAPRPSSSPHTVLTSRAVACERPFDVPAKPSAA